MAADMVASVTLRLRDQMSAGIDEIKREFGSVQATLDKLTVVLGDLQGTLDALRMPGAINQSLRGTIGEADAAARAVTSIGAAADANIDRFRAMNASLNNWTGVGAPINGVNASEVPNAEPSPRDPIQRMGGPRRESDTIHKHTDWLTDGIIGAITIASGYDAIKKYGDYDKTLRQIAITEKLSGPAATDETLRLRAMFDHLSVKDRQSSAALADAYFRMITTHIPAPIVSEVMPDIAMMATAHDVSPYDMADAAFAINDSYKIGPNGMLPALEMLATAAKQAHFSLANFGTDLKSIGGVMNTMQLTGRDNLNMAAASLETIIKNSTQPNQAAADYRDFLVYLNSSGIQMAGERLLFKRRLAASQPLFDKYHIKPVSIWAIEDGAKAKGQNEQEAVLDYLHGITKKMPGADAAKYLNTMFGNQQSAMAVESILLHWKQYNALISKLGNVNMASGMKDFETATKGVNSAVDRLDENLTQLERGIGRHLVPALHTVNWLLDQIPTDTPVAGGTRAQAAAWRRKQQSLEWGPMAVGTAGEPLPAAIMPNDSNRAAHTDAMHHHAAALRDHADALRSGAHSGGSAPTGPMLNRP
jgi:hypothetical protein